MKTTKNTVLITGGGSGIGLETARLFIERGNTVIVAGRNEEKLKKAAASLKGLHYVVADVTDETSIDRLVSTIQKDFPTLNILINNAGLAYIHKGVADELAYDNALSEMVTNYLATLRLSGKLLPLLKKQKEAAIANISSIVSFAPAAQLSTYSASKAALHSYTQTLRLSLRDSSVKIFEVMPPLVDTDFAKDIAGSKMSPVAVAEAIITGLETDDYEIHPGGTADLYKVFLSSPNAALNYINGIA